MDSTRRWFALIDEFRSFGGQVENVIQRQGPLGLGLFPIDPNLPVDLMVPKPLLVPANNVELRDGDAVIRDDSAFPTGYADWFRRYQAEYSWGGEGEASVTRFETGLQHLPESLRRSLRGLDLYQAEQRLRGTTWRGKMLRRFLNSRCLGRHGQLLVMPIVELVNHSPMATNWETQPDGGVRVSGHHDGEVLVKYSNADSLRRLMGYGFNTQEPMAFSLSVQLQHRGQPVIVRGGGGRHWFRPPEIQRMGQQLVLDKLLLGFRQGPRLPKSLFLKACQGLAEVNSSELFEQIHQANTLAVVDLLRRLEGVPGETAGQLRHGCLDQLSALSHHFGHRPGLISDDSAISEPGHACPEHHRPWDNPPIPRDGSDGFRG